MQWRDAALITVIYEPPRLTRWGDQHSIARAVIDVPVALFGVGEGELLHFVVHALVELGAEEVGPEAVERVHFARLTDAQILPLCDHEMCECPTNVLEQLNRDCSTTTTIVCRVVGGGV